MSRAKAAWDEMGRTGAGAGAGVRGEGGVVLTTDLGICTGSRFVPIAERKSLIAREARSAASEAGIFDIALEEGVDEGRKGFVGGGSSPKF